MCRQGDDLSYPWPIRRPKALDCLMPPPPPQQQETCSAEHIQKRSLKEDSLIWVVWQGS